MCVCLLFSVWLKLCVCVSILCLCACECVCENVLCVWGVVCARV